MATQNDSEITRLKEAVAGTFGKTLDSPADFDALALSIQGKTGECISPTTLKRLFGYVKPATVPRTSTLSVLARYVGKAGWSDFSAQPVHQEPAEQPAQSEPSVPSAPVERKDGIRKYLPPLDCSDHIINRYRYRPRFQETRWSRASKDAARKSLAKRTVWMKRHIMPMQLPNIQK